jgi:uncharacterized protein (DUF58 family)
MGRIGRSIYVALLAAFCAIAVVALVAGLWIYTVFAIIFGGLFAYSAPFVLGKKWESPERTGPRRPVRRRPR